MKEIHAILIKWNKTNDKNWNGLKLIKLSIRKCVLVGYVGLN